MPFEIKKHKMKNWREELAEKEKDAGEVADLIRTKCKVTKNMEKRLVQAKNTIANLKAEVDALHSARTDGPQEESQEQPPREIIRASVPAAIVWRASTAGTLKFSKR